MREKFNDFSARVQGWVARNSTFLRVWLCLFAAYLVCTVHYELYHRYGDYAESLLIEFWFNVRGDIDPPEDVILIAIDEDSYIELDLPFNRPWPRELHGQLLEKLARAGVKKVGFDVLFADPSPDPAADEALKRGFDAQESAIGVLLWKPRGSDIREPIFPYEPFRESAQMALVSFPQGGMLLHFKTQRSKKSQGIPTLSEAVSGVRTNLPGPRDFIWYYGPAQTIQTFSYFEVLELEVEDLVDFFRDKYVIVGLSLETAFGSAEKDTFLSPFWNRDGQFIIPFFSSRIFGAEVHATATANLLQNTWVRRASVDEENFWLTLTVFCCAFLINFFGPVPGFIILLVSIVSWLYASFEMFMAPSHSFLPGVLAAACLVTNYVGCILLYYFSTYRDQKKTRDAFSTYLSPVMAREVSKDPTQRKLGGDVTNATAMFTDIAGFTSITEKMPADQVSKMLNEYFTEVVRVVQENQGTLIKFIGDAIFAIWGAPIATEEHADRAIRTALQIDKEVKEFNRRGLYPALHTRIGVNTGQMVVGNLGTKTRMDYTAIGDAVNFSARLEGLNKYFGTTVLISTSSAAEASRPYLFTRMGWVNVAGKSEAVPVYTIFDPILEKNLENLWREGQDVYRARQWEVAEAIFTSILHEDPRLEKAIGVYLENIRKFRASPPGKDWQGSLIFSQK